MALAPRTDQRIPDCLRRSPNHLSSGVWSRLPAVVRQTSLPGTLVHGELIIQAGQHQIGYLVTAPKPFATSGALRMGGRMAGPIKAMVGFQPSPIEPEGRLWRAAISQKWLNVSNLEAEVGIEPSPSSRQDFIGTSGIRKIPFTTPFTTSKKSGGQMRASGSAPKVRNPR
jgi:hypothetical protein